MIEGLVKGDKDESKVVELAVLLGETRITIHGVEPKSLQVRVPKNGDLIHLIDAMVGLFLLALELDTEVALERTNENLPQVVRSRGRLGIAEGNTGTDLYPLTTIISFFGGELLISDVLGENVLSLDASVEDSHFSCRMSKVSGTMSLMSSKDTPRLEITML